MKHLPAGLDHYKSTPVFDQDTVPAGLRRAHSTAAGVWAASSSTRAACAM